MIISAAQCRAARALLHVNLDWLAKRSGVSRRAIAYFEAGTSKPKPDNLVAIRQAFEEAGVEFLEGDGLRRA